MFPPSPTVAPTLTPSVVPTLTLSPTITLTPTITDTPLVSVTPTGTATPFLPMVVEAQFVSVVTPNPDAVISPLVFAISVKNGLPESPSTLFRNPVTRIFASFSYDNMVPGAQWSAVWYRNGEYIFHESYPWDGATGGYYYSECVSPAGGWQPGEYAVQIFVGVLFKRAGFFTVEGDAPPTPAPSSTLSPIPSSTVTP
jgi:type VI secretion system secreted protein VgrG